MPRQMSSDYCTVLVVLLTGLREQPHLERDGLMAPNDGLPGLTSVDLTCTKNTISEGRYCYLRGGICLQFLIHVHCCQDWFQLAIGQAT